MTKKPQKFWIEQSDEEHIKLFVGEKSIASFNHDEHGWSGMKNAEEIFEKVAKAVGSDFERRFT